MADASSRGSRPYRSHKVPACQRCRQRKIRCHIDLAGQPCLFCRSRALKCHVPAEKANDINNESSVSSRLSRSRRLPRSEATSAALLPAEHGGSPTSPAKGKVSIILGPVVAEDVEILMRHVPEPNDNGADPHEPYQSVSQDATNPVVYVPVPRGRRGLSSPDAAGKVQLEVIEQILGPHKQELLRLYFSYIHWNFPVIDKATSKEALLWKTKSLSSSQACVIYAMALQLWQKSDQLRLHPCPDQHYAWNQAVTAFHEDFKAPSMSTVSAGVIDLIGRPSESLVGNITNCARLVALAQTLGLSRDPSAWRISDDEKTNRIHLFWGVLINDVWSSIAYGIAPKLMPGSYDTPLPPPDDANMTKEGGIEELEYTSFVQLCSLTQILSEALPLVYQLKPDYAYMFSATSRLQSRLQGWRDALPANMMRAAPAGGTMAKSSNLWFCFLSTKLVLCHLTLKATVKGNVETDPEFRAACLAELRNAATQIVDFIALLSDEALQSFWLPYISHLLVAATLTLIRCIVETEDESTRKMSTAKLVSLRGCLKQFQDDHGWDLGELCLERCSSPIQRIADVVQQRTNKATDVYSTFAGEDLRFPDLFGDDWLEQDFLPMVDRNDGSWFAWNA